MCHSGKNPAIQQIRGERCANTQGAFIAAIVLLLPLMYVGSYLALVTPSGTWLHPFEPKLMMRVDYRLGAHRVAWIFWPLEQLDRKMRPRAWDPWPGMALDVF